MATKLHKDMVQACRKIFPHLNSEATLRTRDFKYLPLVGPNSIPDFASPDNNFAIECETLGKQKQERFHNHSKHYKEILLVIPLLENVKEIWMYTAGEFRKFKEA